MTKFWSTVMHAVSNISVGSYCGSTALMKNFKAIPQTMTLSYTLFRITFIFNGSKLLFLGVLGFKEKDKVLFFPQIF